MAKSLRVKTQVAETIAVLIAAVRELYCCTAAAARRESANDRRSLFTTEQNHNCSVHWFCSSAHAPSRPQHSTTLHKLSDSHIPQTPAVDSSHSSSRPSPHSFHCQQYQPAMSDSTPTEPTYSTEPTLSTPGPTSQLGLHPSSFPPIDADADVDRLTSLPSLCMNCREEGETRLLLTSIPYFRDVIIMSFNCPHCHFQSSEVQPAAEIQDRGRRFTLTVTHTNQPDTHRDLNRQLIKSETATLTLPTLDFTIAPTRTRGDINTVEGVLGNVIDSLQVDQPNRALQDMETHDKIGALIEKLQAMKDGELSFTLVVEDHSGNSYIENPYAPHPDPRVKLETYARTPEQTDELGYAQEAVQESEEKEQAGRAALLKRQGSVKAGTATSDSGAFAVSPLLHEKVDTYFNVSDRSAVLKSTCHACHRECETRMAVTDIPHFKEVVLMATQCDHCGYRDTEVKPAGRVSTHAIRTTLQVRSADDLKRDVLKSDTSSVEIPEIDLELVAGTLGGKYTTLEGILNDVKTQLSSLNPFHLGDSSEEGEAAPFRNFLRSLDALIDGTRPFTFVLDDPLGNSFVWTELGEGKDEQLTVERYERTWEQNEELGLNDLSIDVNDYATDEDVKVYEAEMKAEAEQRGVGADEKQAKKEAGERARLLEGVKEGKVGGLIRVDESEKDS